MLISLKEDHVCIKHLRLLPMSASSLDLSAAAQLFTIFWLYLGVALLVICSQDFSPIDRLRCLVCHSIQSSPRENKYFGLQKCLSPALLTIANLVAGPFDDR